MSSRKRAQVFRRSFVGCWTCRRRKVKCDARRPHCDRCTRAKVPCDGYNIKLNWSMPLTNMAGEYCSLSGKPVNGGEEKPGEIEMQDDSSTIQRSNIELVRWWLYDYYHEMDNALAVLEKTPQDRSGPFGVIREGYRVSVRKRKAIQQDPKPTQEETRNSIPEPPVRPPLSKSSSLSEQPAPEMTRDFTSTSSSITTTPAPPLAILQPFRDITTHSLHYTEPIQLTKATVVDHGRLIQEFIDSIPDLFDSSIKGRLSAKVREITGNYVISDKPLDFCLVLAIITLTLLRSVKSSEHTVIFKIISYKQKIDTVLSEQSRDAFHEYEPLAFLLVLLIMINSTLGVYDERLFQFPLDELYHSTDPLMRNYYRFFQSTNILFNHDQFQFDAKFFKIYADMLDPDYNLLKEVEKPQRPKLKMSDEIKISASETPADKIIRVPRYIDEDHDVDDNEPPPPTFTIHFEGVEKNDKKRETNIDPEQQSLDQADQEERVLHDEVDEESDNDELEDSLSLINVFHLQPTTKDTPSVFGISNNLITLYAYLCQLINHRRHFHSVNMNSRNFAKVCADFEDVLMRQAPAHCHSELDEEWYHLLVVLYFKLVQNFPKSMLLFHLKKIGNSGPSTQKIGLFKFVKSMGGDLWTESDHVWGNNWALKEWLWKNRLDAFKDWHHDEEAPKRVFLF